MHDEDELLLFLVCHIDDFDQARPIRTEVTDRRGMTHGEEDALNTCAVDG